MYDGGGMWKPVHKKDNHARIRLPDELKTRSKRGRLSYLRQERRSDTNAFWEQSK